MTKREFMDELAKLRRKFRHYDGVKIRCRQGDCPIVAVAKRHGLLPVTERANFSWHRLSVQLGLSTAFAVHVVRAADGQGAPKTRQALIATLGLPAPSQPSSPPGDSK